MIRFEKADFSPSYYERLGVVPTATIEEIKTAYKSIVRKIHPDQHTGEADKKSATAELVQVNKAYEVLENPSSKALYDAQFAILTLRTPTKDFGIHASRNADQRTSETKVKDDDFEDFLRSASTAKKPKDHFNNVYKENYFTNFNNIKNYEKIYKRPEENPGQKDRGNPAGRFDGFTWPENKR